MSILTHVTHISRPLAWCLLALTTALSLPVQAHNGKVAVAVPLEGIVIDGELSDWPEDMTRYPIELQEDGVPLEGPEDFEGSFRVGYSVAENALYVAVEASDNSVVPGKLGEGRWDTQDGCEIYVEPRHRERNTQPIQYQLWGPNRGVFAGRGSVSDMDVVARWEEQGYRFEWKIDMGRATAGRLRLQPEMWLGFDVAVWEKDEDGSASWMCWGRERGKYMRSSTLGDLLLVADATDLEAIMGLSTEVFERSMIVAKEEIRTLTGYQMFFTGVLAAVSLLHLLLFLFDPGSRVNLFYALYTGLVAASVFLGFHLEYTRGTDPILSTNLKNLAIFAVGVLGLRFLYAMFYTRTPRVFRYFAGWLGVCAAFYYWLISSGGQVPSILWQAFDIAFQVFTVVVLVETMRVIIVAILRRKDGGWIIGLGFSAFALNVTSLIAQEAVDVSLVYWVLLPLISMSVYLARSVAKTNRELSGQLEQVERLSAETRTANEAMSLANRELVRTSEQLNQSNLELQEKSAQLETANEEVLKASQAKSAFLANMSHEIRTPLNAVINFSALIRDGVLGKISDDMRDVVEEIGQNGKHLLELVNDILDLSKIEAGAMQIEIGECVPATCVENAVFALEYEAQAKGLRVIGEVADDLPEIRADGRRITQHVLVNLLKNAIKFTDSGEIRVGARARNGEVLFWVSDTGIGIAPEEHEQIFESFHQTDGSDTRKAGGTGLGLAIARRFVEMHRGHIWVESAVGEGATFYFSLPARSAADVPATPVSE